MERFLKRHEGRIKGIISGFDRIQFRGSLRSINYRKGIEIWLASRGILLKDFAPFAEGLSQRLKKHARTLAEKHGRPYLYLESSEESKEEVARRIMKEQGIEKGLICVLSWAKHSPRINYSIRSVNGSCGMGSRIAHCILLARKTPNRSRC